MRARAREVAAAAEADRIGRYQRQCAAAALRHGVDESDGMVWGHFRLPPDTGAAVVTRLEAETDRVRREARAAGRHASRERYAAEALVRVVTGAADDGTGGGEAGGEVHEVDGAGGPAPVSTGRRAPAAGAGELLLMVDLAAWRRGAVEGDEICTIAGFGDVPVEVPRRLLDEGGFLTLVLREGTRVHAVHRVGRRIPAALRSALGCRGGPGRRRDPLRGAGL